MYIHIYTGILGKLRLNFVQIMKLLTRKRIKRRTLCLVLIQHNLFVSAQCMKYDELQWSTGERMRRVKSDPLQAVLHRTAIGVISSVSASLCFAQSRRQLRPHDHRPRGVN